MTDQQRCFPELEIGQEVKIAPLERNLQNDFEEWNMSDEAFRSIVPGEDTSGNSVQRPTKPSARTNTPIKSDVPIRLNITIARWWQDDGKKCQLQQKTCQSSNPVYLHLLQNSRMPLVRHLSQSQLNPLLNFLRPEPEL